MQSILKIDKASQLVNALDPKFIIITMFLADLMYILSKMIKTFQCNHIDLSKVKYSLKITISAIEAQFIRTNETPPTYGMILHQYIVDNNIPSNSLPSFISKLQKQLLIL